MDRQIVLRDRRILPSTFVGIQSNVIDSCLFQMNDNHLLLNPIILILLILKSIKKTGDKFIETIFVNEFSIFLLKKECKVKSAW